MTKRNVESGINYNTNTTKTTCCYMNKEQWRPGVDYTNGICSGIGDLAGFKKKYNPWKKTKHERSVYIPII